MCNHCGFRLYEPHGEIVQGKSYLALGEFEQAHALVTSAYQKATDMHYRWPEGDAAHLMGEIYLAIGNKDNAREWLEKAVSCRKKILDPKVKDSETTLKSFATF